MIEISKLHGDFLSGEDGEVKNEDESEKGGEEKEESYVDEMDLMPVDDGEPDPIRVYMRDNDDNLYETFMEHTS